MNEARWLIGYLFGSPSAIRQAAATRASLGYGLLFVLIAALLREYDGEDLLAEPWHAAIPFAASWAAATLLFLPVHGLSRWRRRPEVELPTIGRAYRSFLALFWLTAPLAWFYAIPYERMVEPLDAIRLNLATLAIVAFWRVALMTRIISVLYGLRWQAVLPLVLLVSSVIVFAAMSFAPAPIIDVMGGLRQTEREQLVARTTFMVMLVTVLSFPIVLIGSLVAVWFWRPQGGDWIRAAPERSWRGLTAIGVGAGVVTIILLGLGQPEQMRRTEAERLIAAGRLREALRRMDSLGADAYPPLWIPPLPTSQTTAEPLRMIAVSLDEVPETSWIRRHYVPQLRRALLIDLFPYHGRDDLVQAIGRSFEYSQLADTLAEALLRLDPSLTADERLALESLRSTFAKQRESAESESSSTDEPSAPGEPSTADGASETDATDRTPRESD
ncbi:MAG TPA: hypothetical protein PLI18_19275 [Pirellulaceae bacterium]|nr:hypothetical protein [Pirellulaceae bacterium]